MPVYATVEEFEVYLADTPPANAEMLLSRASNLMVSATRAAVYAVDGNDLPTDASLLAALNEATLAQATAWFLNDIDPRKGIGNAVEASVASKSLGGASVSYSTPQGFIEGVAGLASGQVLDIEAHRILLEAGLLSTNVQSPYSPLANEADLL